MSWQQSLTAAIFGTVVRVANSVAPAKPSSAHRPATPPRSVTRSMATRSEAIVGVPCTWMGDPSSDTVVVYLHGGSYAFGAIGLQWAWAAALAREIGAAALFVDYALAGEQPYPVALEQVLAVSGALRAGGVTRLVIAGDSAGGGLAAATAERLRDAATGADALVLVSPWLDVTLADPAVQGFEKRDIMLSAGPLRGFGLLYAGSTDPRDPGVSPLYGSAAGLPPTIVHVGDAEMFLPDDTNWAGAVAGAGGEVELHVIRGGFHVSAIVGWLPEGKRALREQAAFLRRVLPER